jgi:catechol 2,3-dioxygenase-like lactoylglutathione lyase family enzyme
MFSHVVLGANDIDASKKFYDAIIGAVGGNPGFADPSGRIVYAHGGGVLLLSKPIDGQPATHANGGTIGFAISSPEQADAWHAAGLAAGGTTCEDPPGERPGSGMYLAYLRDPAGNKLCGLHRLG